MSKFQLPGPVIFDSQNKIHTSTEYKDVSLAKEFKYHLEGEHRKNGVIDQGKSRKIFMKRKWTEIKYHVQDNADVEHKDVKMYCNANDNACRVPLHHEVWNVDHKRVMLGIDLFYSTFSHL